jgi:hypothetical protein
VPNSTKERINVEKNLFTGYKTTTRAKHKLVGGI